MTRNKTLNTLLFIFINPVSIWIYTFFISVFIWGPGLVAIGITIFTCLFSLIPFAIFSIIKKPTDKLSRRILLSISVALIAIGWNAYQFYGARGENLKSFLIDETIRDEFLVQNSDVYFAGGEDEIWLKLESNKNAIEKLISSREFVPIKRDVFSKLEYFPDWWPNSFIDYYFYEFKNSDTEQFYRLLVSKDYKSVYYYYLSY